MNYGYKNTNINIVVSGEGAPLILLHGWGCDNTIYDGCRDYLSTKYRVYAFDLPGFGSSDEPSSVWGTQDYVDMLRAFIEDNSIEAPSLMGHSFGGRVSILYSAQYSVSKVILIDAAGVVPARSVSYYYKVYSYKFARKMCEVFLPRAKAATIIEKWRSKSGSSDYNNASQRMRAVLSKAVNEDLRRVMPNISAPVLLFWGDRDTATPISDAKCMEHLIPDAGLVVATGCGHFSFLESRGLFDAVVKNFLSID